MYTVNAALEWQCVWFGHSQAEAGQEVLPLLRSVQHCLWVWLVCSCSCCHQHKTDQWTGEGEKSKGFPHGANKTWNHKAMWLKERWSIADPSLQRQGDSELWSSQVQAVLSVGNTVIYKTLLSNRSTTDYLFCLTYPCKKGSMPVCLAEEPYAAPNLESENALCIHPAGIAVGILAP